MAGGLKNGNSMSSPPPLGRVLLSGEPLLVKLHLLKRLYPPVAYNATPVPLLFEIVTLARLMFWHKRKYKPTVKCMKVGVEVLLLRLVLTCSAEQ